MANSKFEDINKRLDSIIEHSYDGIYITDGKGNTLKINEAYEKITGLKRSNMLGKNMKELVEEGYVSESGSLKVMKERKTVSLNQTFKTGKKALITSKPVFDENGDIILIITNIRDMTELYNLKNKLDEKNRLIEKYYNETMELKNKLNENKKLVVENKKMIDLVYSTKKISSTDFTVLISGESGVGKEVIAKFIHESSRRSKANFVKVNCGAIPENLIESELFGYVKGAFSGARDEGKLGYFEMADKGTLFLDEIGELPLNMQVKLLRVLQESEVTRVGSVKAVKIDVRIITATNRDLEKMVEEGTFRKDLFYRINVIPITIPPLRERREDIVALGDYFLEGVNKKYGWSKGFSREAYDVLSSYCWPGNIRELKNIVERSVAMSPDDLIGVDDLPAKIVTKKAVGLSIGNQLMPLKKAQIEIEKVLIEAAYEKFGNVRDAAKVLEIDPSTLVRKRKRYYGVAKKQL
ncbi:MAG: sigma 54-interacting transcriptional regulator [Firmicutes bacterium]|jgi:PAS domain S-box-containing protein|nr:sigma 54-interacting transcriptional regulator [Bacillota bacterium]